MPCLQIPFGARLENMEFFWALWEAPFRGQLNSGFSQWNGLFSTAPVVSHPTAPPSHVSRSPLAISGLKGESATRVPKHAPSNYFPPVSLTRFGLFLRSSAVLSTPRQSRPGRSSPAIRVTPTDKLPPHRWLLLLLLLSPPLRNRSSTCDDPRAKEQAHQNTPSLVSSFPLPFTAQRQSLGKGKKKRKKRREKQKKKKRDTDQVNFFRRPPPPHTTRARACYFPVSWWWWPSLQFTPSKGQSILHNPASTLSISSDIGFRLHLACYSSFA